MEPMEIDTILFDLDGTLIDTEPSAARAVAACFQDWGIPIDVLDAQHITGRTWASAFSFLFNKYPLPLSRQDAAESIMQKYRETIENELHQVPGSAAAVRALADHYRLGLVSGSGRKEILWALEKLQIREKFQIILGAEDYARSKPQPDGYLLALKMLQSQASRTLIFEDSLAGIQSARSAGAWVVAITSTNHFNQDNSNAHDRIPDLTEITPDWVSRFLTRVS